VSFTTNATSMTQSGFVTLSAVVVDSAGVSALTGGTLTDVTGATSFGSFTESSAGNYTMTLTWAAINTARPITFVGESALTVEATFTDSANLHQSKSLDLELLCGNGASPNAACSGTCVDLSTSTDCGSCGATCPGSSTCASPGSCTFTTSIDVGEGPAIAGEATAGTPSVTCTTACSSATTGITGATCTSATATLVDGTSPAIGCGVSGLTYSTSQTVSYTADLVYCQCSSTEGFYKLTSGNCSSICTSGGVSTCIGLGTAQNELDGTGAYVDSCSAPYVYADWDDVVPTAETEADGGFEGQNATTVSLKDAPVSIGCNCQVAPTP
jgi:hypothetical protein